MFIENRMLNLLADFSQTHSKRQIQFLKAENRILRAHCPLKRIILSPREKNLLLKFGMPLGPDIKPLISVVHYSTFRKWIREKNCPTPPAKKRGRPRIITPAIRALIVEMARLNKWGYTKILAQLKILRVKRLSRTSVANILREYGIDPLKYRREDTWDQFLKRTFTTLWACDFFSKSVWTPFGRRLYHVLFFINVKTRKVHLAGITKTVTAQWLQEQVQKLDDVFALSPGKAALVRDRGIQFTKEFDQFFEERKITVMPIPARSPNLNPYAESWVATIKRECLDYFLVLSQVHLEYLVYEFVDYYNRFRPHSALDNGPPEKMKVKTSGKIRARPVLGGLTHHYFRE